MNKPLIIISLCAAFVAAMAGSVVSQSPGLVAPGFVMGNGSAVNPSTVAPYSASSILDQGLGSTNGGFAVRGASVYTNRLLAGTDLPAPTALNRGGLLTTQFREVLTGARTYFVRTDGSNSNDCLSNTAGGACLTIQGAIDKAVTIDGSGFNVTIQVADGTYTGNINLKPIPGANVISLVGNTGTPANVLLDFSTTTGILCGGATSLLRYTINGFKLQHNTSGHNLIIAGSGCSLAISNINFGATVGAGNHMLLNFQGSIVISTNYTISGNTNAHAVITQGSILQTAGITVTLTGTPAWGTAFVVSTTAAVGIMNGNTYSGAATGARCSITSNSVIDAGGAGATYFPGNSGCAAPATGGQYL